MERNLNRETSIIINDLDSMVHRIEMLQAHPGYTAALQRVMEARDRMKAAQSDIHQRAMNDRFGTKERLFDPKD